MNNTSLTKKQILKAAIISGFFFLSLTAHAADEATITVQAGAQTRAFTRAQLLAQAQTVVVEKDPAYPKLKMTYQAVPLATLFDGVKLEDSNTLLFKCLDGFSAAMSVPRVLNHDPKKARAFLAIEPADKPWPETKAGKSAGPFYIVWQNSAASNISIEEWPFQISGFEVKPSLEIQFPATKPDPKLSEIDPVRRGYLAFQKTCFACHTLNGQGSSHLGPDLNLPMNPTEYLKPGMIEKLVRDPGSLRRWPDSKMPSLNKEAISDRDLENVISYLRHMSHRKIKTEN